MSLEVDYIVKDVCPICNGEGKTTDSGNHEYECGCCKGAGVMGEAVYGS